MLRGTLLILVALFIDGLQLSLMLGLMGIVSTVSLIPFVGAAAGPIGFILGLVINICISLTAGPALLLALGLTGMFYPSKLLPAAIKIIPFVNMAPVWTIAVARCVFQKFKEQKGMSVVAAVKQRIANKNPHDARIPRLAKATFAAQVIDMHGRELRAPQAPLDTARHSPAGLKSFDGIRAKNPTYAAAA